MKKVRLILSASMLTIAGFTAMTTMTSCGGDDKECLAGYEGNNCDVEIREQMIGSYDAVDVRNSDALTKTYVPVISKNASVTVINISGFGDFFDNTEIVTSNVTKSGDVINFTIPEQKPDMLNTVSGSGTYTISSKKISITYTLSNGIDLTDRKSVV